MQNPNAVAVLASTQAAVAGEEILSKYLDANVGSFWSKEIMAGAAIAVLYIGRHGIKAALGKVASTGKAVWTGPKK
jgi:hypothetical protein